MFPNITLFGNMFPNMLLFGNFPNFFKFFLDFLTATVFYFELGLSVTELVVVAIVTELCYTLLGISSTYHFCFL
jgi:hypothetical protein